MISSYVYVFETLSVTLSYFKETIRTMGFGVGSHGITSPNVEAKSHVYVFETLSLTLSYFKETIKTRGFGVGSHGIPSPNVEAKSQLLSLKKPFKNGQFLLKLDLYYFM